MFNAHARRPRTTPAAPPNGADAARARQPDSVDPRTVVKLCGSALRKTKGGRYAAKPSDTLFRPLVVPVQGGRIEVGVRGSRAASELSKRAIAQREFLKTGDDTKLRKLRKTKILDASGREVRSSRMRKSSRGRATSERFPMRAFTRLCRIAPGAPIGGCDPPRLDA